MIIDMIIYHAYIELAKKWHVYVSVVAYEEK